MVFILVVPTSMNEERSAEVRSTPLLGFLFIIIIGTTSSTAIGEAAIISGNGAAFLVFGCERDSSSAKLMSQLMMDSICRVHLCAQTSDIGPLRATVGRNQASGSCLLVHFAYEDQSPKLFASARRHFSELYLPTISPREHDVNWASLGKAPEVGCAY